MKEKLVDAITNMREDEALKLTQEMLDSGEAPQTILDAGREVLALVGDRVDKKKYYLPDERAE